MSEDDQEERRVTELVAALVERRLAESLGRVEEAIRAWRRGEKSLEEAHGETLRHGARAQVLTERVGRAARTGPVELLRDALAAGLLDESEFKEITGEASEQVAAPPSLDEEVTRGPAREEPPKRLVMERLLDEGPVLVHLDPRRAGVKVPGAHVSGPRLVLRFGHQLTPPIPDLNVGESALEGTLTFQGVPFRCVVPWSAVFALVSDDGRGRVWPSDLPTEVAGEYTAREQGTEPPKPEPPKPKGRGHLKLV
jgi:stringent starvation protein B